MANKRGLAWVVVLAAIVAVGLMAHRYCGIDREYRQMREEYEEMRRIAEADRAMSRQRIEELNGVVGRMTERIADLEREAAASEAEIAGLEGELAAIQDAEPPTTPDVESLPIVINLRQQVGTLSEMLSLSRRTVETQRVEIAAWGEKCAALEGVAAEWRDAYERERALRIQAEGLFEACGRRVKVSKYVTYAAMGAGFVAGYLIGK